MRGSDVTLKKFYRDPGGRIRLQPANAAMQPIFVDPDQVQVQGVVVGRHAEVLNAQAPDCAEHARRRVWPVRSCDDLRYASSSELSSEVS